MTAAETIKTATVVVYDVYEIHKLGIMRRTQTTDKGLDEATAELVGKENAKADAEDKAKCLLPGIVLEDDVQKYKKDEPPGGSA